MWRISVVHLRRLLHKWPAALSFSLGFVWGITVYKCYACCLFSFLHLIFLSVRFWLLKSWESVLAVRTILFCSQHWWAAETNSVLFVFLVLLSCHFYLHSFALVALMASLFSLGAFVFCASLNVATVVLGYRRPTLDSLAATSLFTAV